MSFKKCALRAGITSEDMAEMRQHIQRAGNDAQGIQDYLDGIEADFNDLRNQTGTQLVTESVEKPGEDITGEVVDMIKALKPAVLNQAQEQGYEGDSVGESKEWLAALKKFGPEGMTHEARMARAEDMGFDTKTTYYHGSTSGDIKEFDLSRNAERFGQEDEGIFFTDQAYLASGYAGEGIVESFGGGTVYPVLLKSEKPLIINDETAENIFGWYEVVSGEGSPVHFWDTHYGEVLAHAKSNDSDAIYIDDGNEVMVVSLNPKNARSINAAFDPDFKDSPVLLAQEQTEAGKYEQGRESGQADIGRQAQKPSDYTRATGRTDEEALAEYEKAKRGEPVSFVHRSEADFNQFSDDQLGKNTTTPSASLGHFLSSVDVGNNQRYGNSVSVWKTQLKNPIVIDAETFADTMDGKTESEVAEMRQRFIDAGHDGILVNGLNWMIALEGASLEQVRDDSAQVFEQSLASGLPKDIMEIRDYLTGREGKTFKDLADIAISISGQSDGLSAPEDLDGFNEAMRKGIESIDNAVLVHSGRKDIMASVWASDGSMHRIMKGRAIAQSEKEAEIATLNILSEEFTKIRSGGAKKAFVQPLTEEGNYVETQDLQPASSIRYQSTFIGKEKIKSVAVGFSSLDTAEKIAYATSALNKSAQEKLWVVILDEKNKPLEVMQHSMGGVDSATAYPSIIAGYAANVEGAKHVWMSHNHPSGTQDLSKEDINLSDMVRTLFDGSGIDYHGIIAVTSDGYAGELGEWGGFAKPKNKKKTNITERIIESSTKGREAIKNPLSARKVIKELSDGLEGVLMLDTSLRPTGFFPVDMSEAALKDGNGDLSRSAKVLSAFEATNSNSALIVSRRGFGEAPRNLTRLLNAADIRVLDVMDEDASAAEAGLLDKGTRFYQEGEAEPRGTITKDLDVSIIKLYNSANASTFLHEAGHLFLKMTGKLYDHPKSTPEIKADGDAILSFLGAESFEAITVDQHEKWARAQEKYFGEGKAPSLELQGAFRRFSQWLKEIYRSLLNLNVELTDDIRQVMDRMLATDEQIDRLKGNFKPLFDNAEDAGMTEPEFKAYEGNASPEAAKEELFKKLVKELRRQETRAWKEEKGVLQAQIIEDLERMPIYSAEKYLRTPEVIPSKEAEKKQKEFEAKTKKLFKNNDTALTFLAKAGGLNREYFQSQGVDKDIFKKRSRVFGKPIFPKEGGLTADDVAEKYNEINGTEITENDALEWVNDALAEDFFMDKDIDAEYQYILEDVLIAAQADNDAGSNKILKSDVKALIPGRIPRRLGGIVSEFGTSSEILAGMFGFASGEEMIKLMAGSKTLKAQANETAEIEMMGRHGDALNDGRIEEEAELAMRNDSRAKKLLAELRSLSRKTNKPAIDRLALREYARAEIAKKRISSIYPSQYRAAEIRSARAAAVAKSKGDLDGAQEAKTQEIINFYLGKEAVISKGKSEKIRAAHKVIQTKKYDPKKYNNDPYVNTAKVIARVFDYRKSSKVTEEQGKLELENARLWIESQQKDPESSSPYLVQAEILGRLIPYSDMTVEDLQGLDDSIQSLMKAARETSEQANKIFKDEMARVGDSIVKNRIEEYKTEVDNDTPYVKSRQLFDGVSASLRKLDSFTRQADAFIEQGPVWKSVIKPLLDASRTALTMRNTAGEDLKAVFHDYQGVFGATLGGDIARDLAAKTGIPIGDGNKKTFTFESGQVQRMSYGSRVAVALNMGNKGNYEAMTSMNSMPLTEKDVSDIVATLSDKDWDLVQNIWDYIDTYWPMAAELEKTRSGAAPIKVSGRSFATPGGREMKGGYYPLSSDPTEDTKLGDMDTQAAKFIGGGSVSKATKTGSLIERTQFGGKKINFSINVVFNHIDEVIHDVSHWQAVHDVSRVLNNHRVNGELTKSLGPAGITAMQQRLKEIAAGPQRIDALTWWERPLRYARLGVTYGALGYSVSTSLKNIVGLTTAVPEVGALNLSSSVSKWAASPMESGKFVTSKSEYMVERSQVINRDIAQIRASLRTDGVIDTIKDYSFWFMTQTDKLTTQPIWMAAYEKGQVMFETEEEVIDFADQTVRRTQGSGDTMDLSNAETRSELMKTMTIMYSAMNAIYGIAAEQRLRYKARAIPGAGSITTAELFKNMMWLTVVPGLLMAIISNSDKDDEPEKVAGNIIGEIAGQTLGLVPGVRDAYSLARYGSSFPSPLVDVLSSPVNFIRQVKQGELDKGLIRATTNLMTAAHIPGASQLNRTFGYTIDLMDGEIDSFSPWELLVTGKE